MSLMQLLGVKLITYLSYFLCNLPSSANLQQKKNHKRFKLENLDVLKNLEQKSRKTRKSKCI